MLLKCDVAWRTLERGNTKFFLVNWVDEEGLKHNLQKIEKLIFRALGIRQKDPAQKKGGNRFKYFEYKTTHEEKVFYN